MSSHVIERTDTPVTDPASASCTGVLCLRRREHGAPPAPTAGSHRLCTGCSQHLASQVDELAALYRECGYLLGGMRSAQPRDKITGGRLPGLPFNTAAAEARSEIAAVLASWSALVADERGLARPPYAIESMTRFLAEHVDWLAGHLAAAEASDEITRVHAQARQVARRDEPNRVRVGRCVYEGCEGELVAVLHTRSAGRRDEIVCDAQADHVWSSRQWTQLVTALEGRAGREEKAGFGGPAAGAGKRHGRAAEKWITATQVSSLFSTPTGTVYRLASQHAWRRRRHAGRTYYAVTDVHESLTPRAGHSS